VSVIVPAHDAAATLARTLACLAAQDVDLPYEVIVVDDGSRDATPSIVERADGPVRLVRQDPPRGAAGARNRGAAEAAGAVLAFTDSDCYPEPGWLSAGVRRLRSADLVIGAVRPEWGVPLGPFERSLVVERETGLYESANLFVSRELFRRIDGFESWILDRGRPLSEDTWFGWRARRAGASTAFCAEAVVDHAVLPRGALGYVEERLRNRHFPAMIARIPELRREFLYGGVFLSRRSAEFDAALAGAVAARVARSPLPLVAALPYARRAARRARPYRKRGPLVVAVDVAAEAVGLAALVYGSARQRVLVL
jgi:glycosyltransferase involved in cell wall biosynthesis